MPKKKKAASKRKSSASQKKKKLQTQKSTRKPKKKAVKRRPTVKRKNKAVTAVPKGYHSITPYLIVNDAASAIEFYKKVFGAKEVMRMSKPGGKVGHAELIIGDAKIMLADEFPEMGALAPHAFGGTPVTIHLYIKNVDNIVDRAAASGAKILRAVETMFYGDRGGSVEDPFGHKWYISTHVEDVSRAEMKKRMSALSAG
jgi:PhnB protein